MQKFFNEKTYKVVKVAALCTYCAVITYYLFMGANDFNNHISLGVPGMIFSAGIILWLNIFVGIEVACTMYAFYALFRRGGLVGVGRFYRKLRGSSCSSSVCYRLCQSVVTKKPD